MQEMRDEREAFEAGNEWEGGGGELGIMGGVICKYSVFHYL